MTAQSGNYLIATEKLKDSYFDSTVIFLANVSEEEGAYGFIVNRFSHMPANEIFSGVPKELWQTKNVFLGGPVAESEIQVLKMQATAEETPDFLEELGPEQTLESSKDAKPFFDKLLNHDETLLFMGYSGWSAQQLEKEIEDKCWQVASPIDPLLLFKNSPEDLHLKPYEFLTRFC